jgi:hypothetical protein
VIGVAASLVAIGAVAAVVLRDLAAFDRPAAPAPVARPARRSVPVAVPVAVPARPAPADDGSILGTLTATEADERPALRRVGSGLVLLMATLVTAGVVGALIYRGLAGLR